MMALLLLICGLVGLLWAFTAFESRRIEARFPPLGKGVEVGGGNIRLEDWPAQGRERGIALLLHGTSANSADMTVALGERLSAKGFRVLSADRPGYGWSDRVAGKPQGQAEMLRRAAEELGAANVIVVAHSLAAVSALAMSLESPAFVRALVLISPVSHPWSGNVTWYYPVGANPIVGLPFRYLATLPLGMIFMRKAVASVFFPNQAPQNFARSTRLPLVLRPLHFLYNCQDVVRAHAAVVELSPRYHEIRMPTEIVAGDCDHIIEPSIHAVRCAHDIPGANLTMLANVGHVPHHVVPDKIVEVFLRADRSADALEM
jgi:pimeloyl-ACP methyl ester carboxylesterase